MQIENIFKLNTKEDRFHIHKFLGIVSLSNFIYRYYLLFSYGNIFLNTNYDMGLLCIHTGLSVSSLIFHIPNKRHSNLPMIYPEYRLHNIVFALRSILCCFIDFYIVQYKLYYKMSICILTMLSADYITKIYAEPNNFTMRSMPYSELIPLIEQNKITMFYTLQQISATLFMLMNMNSAFSPLFAIQISSFLMTLVRKSIITSNTWHLLYSGSLIINIVVLNSFNSLQFIHIVFGTQYIKYLRLKLKLNKYFCWISLFIIFRFLDLNTDYSFLIQYFIGFYLIIQLYIIRPLYL